MLQEKPCKHPLHPMKKRKRKAFLHLVLAPSPPPTEKKAQVFKTIYRRMYKRDGILFFLFSFCYNMKRKNRQDERKCIFTFKQNCRPSGSV